MLVVPIYMCPKHLVLFPAYAYFLKLCTENDRGNVFASGKRVFADGLNVIRNNYLGQALTVGKGVFFNGSNTNIEKSFLLKKLRGQRA